ncbi:MAG: RidA family protein [Roseiarcus sp.]|jgi:enamine deaminase RidA (YjgF/YER057c/UK114 family)
MSLVAKRLEELGIALPRPASPVADYVPFTRVGALLFVSGQLPLGADGSIAPAYIGRIGPRASLDAAREAARLCAIALVAQAQAAVGDLDRIAQVVRLGGFFAVEGACDELAKAMNGASALMRAAFGAAGVHARTTVGVACLPLGAIAEVEAIFEIRA